MAVITILLVGFKVRGLDGEGEWRELGRGTASIIDAATRPKDYGAGFGAKVRRREGWEDVVWEYKF